MISFCTEYPNEYNYIVHNFFKTETEKYGKRRGSLLEKLVPPYLYREQRERCEEVFQELYDWSADEEEHEMTAFHQLVLYGFLEYLAEVQEMDLEFCDNYFDDRCCEMIDRMSQEEYDEYCDDDSTLDDYRDSYYDMTFYPDVLLEDTDFLIVESMAAHWPKNEAAVKDFLGTDMDAYVELFPLAVQKKYREKHPGV